MSKKAYKNKIKTEKSIFYFSRKKIILFYKKKKEKIEKIKYYFIFLKEITIFPSKFNIQKKLWCTNFTLIKNKFLGLKKFFTKVIELKGIEFKAIFNKKLFLNVGFSHKIILDVPKKINIKIKKNLINLKSRDKCLLGNYCNKIITLKKYNLYKDKGIKFFNEKKTIKIRKKK
ncbi:hypothetical protein [Candidatus Vidania fulgoroideorum]